MSVKVIRNTILFANDRINPRFEINPRKHLLWKQRILIDLQS